VKALSFLHRIYWRWSLDSNWSLVSCYSSLSQLTLHCFAWLL